MKVENMTSTNGNKVANQFIVVDYLPQSIPNEDPTFFKYFQSYQSIIVKIASAGKQNVRVYLDKNKWDYSVTTGKYRNIFLGETKKETQAKIDSGEYILTDLN